MLSTVFSSTVISREGECMEKLISEKVFYRSVMALIIGMPVIEVLTEILSRFSEIFPLFFAPMVISLFGVYGTSITVLYWYTSFKQKRKLRTADIFYLTLIFFMVISAVFSRSPGVYSNPVLNRREEPMIFLAYFWLFFAGTLIDNIIYRKRILSACIAVAILEGIPAFFQTFNIELSYSWLYRADRSAYGLTQNSNYYGCLAVFLIACITGVYIFSEDLVTSKITRYSLPPIAAFVFYTMLGSRARLAWVGFCMLAVFYVISLIIMCRKNRGSKDMKPAVRRALIILAAYAAVFLIAFFFTDYIREVTVRSYWEVANGNTEKMGSDRIYVWQWGLKSVPKHWLTGVGLDNYQYVFDSSPDYVEGMHRKDKAHNEYLHILVTQGIPALINYLTLLIYTCVGAVRSVLTEDSREKRAVTWTLLGMIATYAASAFFNISVPYVVIYFWLAVGLAIPRSPVPSLRSRKT